MSQLNIGVIGAGLRRNIVEIFNAIHQEVAVTSIVDIDLERAQDLATTLSGSQRISRDYKHILEDPEIDAVLLLTPDYLHEAQLVQALTYHKHVFLEKPMAISIEACDRILAACKRSDRKVMMGFNMRYMPLYQTMKKLIDQGTIGSVRSIWVNHYVGRGGRFYFQDWHRNAKNTRSLLVHKGSHDIDMIHMLVGSYAEKVSAFGSLDFYHNPGNFARDGLEDLSPELIDVEDNNMLIMQMKNGVLANYQQCHFTPDYMRNYVVIGDKGRVESFDDRNIIQVTLRGSEQMEETLSYQLKVSDYAHSGGDLAIAGAFIDYILEDKSPKASLLDGRMSVAVGVQATESIRKGGQLQIIPEVNTHDQKV